jgi:uncharacterized membrane protein
MHKTIIGLYNRVTDVDDTLMQLDQAGFSEQDISVLTRQDTLDVKIENDSSEGIKSGAATGGVVGGVLGLLAGVGALTIPGLGALFITGPIAAALGITGVAGATVSGALTGALAGGLIAGLKELGIDEPTAKDMEKKLEEGYTLLAVTADDDTEDEVKEILKDNNAESIKEFELVMKT